MDSTKKRTANFSTKETEILMSLVVDYKDVIECKKSDRTNNAVKQKAWEDLAKKYNCISGENFRDAKTLRGKYENLKKRSKQKFADQKFNISGTGEGLPSILDETDEKIKSIIGTQMTGLPSEFGSDCSPIIDSLAMENTMSIGAIKNHIDEPYLNQYKEEIGNAEEISYIPEIFHVETTEPSSSKGNKSTMNMANRKRDWPKTPQMLRAPIAKELRVKVLKASKATKPTVATSIQEWAQNKTKYISEQSEERKLEHQLKIEQMEELHNAQMDVEAEKLEKIRQEIKHNEFVHQLKVSMMRELHAKELEKLNKK